MCIMLATAASAISIGAGPSTIDFGKMVRGGYAEEVVTVSTSGDEDLTCTIEFLGAAKGWLSADKGTKFTLPANSRADMRVMMQPPADAVNGRYEAEVYIKAAPTSSMTSGAGLVVGAGIIIKVTAEVTGEEKISYKLRRTSVSNTEIGYPLRFTAVVQNTGNVKVTPDIIIEIYDLGGNLKKTFTHSRTEILPTVESLISIDVPTTELDVGRYTAKVIVGKEEQKLTFAVLDRGTLALKGHLKTFLLNKIWVEVGETAKITGEIENTGEILMEGAKLNVEVYLIDEKYQTEKLVKAFSSDESRDVPVGQSAELSTYFTPSTSGRYMIQGSVTYAGKKTQAKSTVLNVLERPTNYLPYIIAVAIVVVGIVYWLTKKGEDGRTRRFRRIWGDYLQIK